MFIHRTRLNCAQVTDSVRLRRQTVVMRRHELPEKLPLPAFTLAQAKELGVSRSRSTAADLEIPSRGLRIIKGSKAKLSELVQSHLAATPGAFASHVTAAILWQIPLPYWLEATSELDISRRQPAAQPRRKGVNGHRLRIERNEITFRRGVWLTTPERTWRDLVAILDEEDLVVAGDFLIRSRQRDFSLKQKSLCSLESLTENLKSRASGNERCRAAAAKIRPGVDSPQETKLRLRLIAAGLPEPTVNHSLDDEIDGRPLRWADLAYPEYKIVIQYEGSHHRTLDQLAADIARDDDWQRAGWTIVRLTAADLPAEGAYAVAKVRAALVRSGCPLD